MLGGRDRRMGHGPLTLRNRMRCAAGINPPPGPTRGTTPQNGRSRRSPGSDQRVGRLRAPQRRRAARAPRTSGSPVRIRGAAEPGFSAGAGAADVGRGDGRAGRRVLADAVRDHGGWTRSRWAVSTHVPEFVAPRRSGPVRAQSRPSGTCSIAAPFPSVRDPESLARWREFATGHFGHIRPHQPVKVHNGSRRADPGFACSERFRVAPAQQDKIISDGRSPTGPASPQLPATAPRS